MVKFQQYKYNNYEMHSTGHVIIQKDGKSNKRFWKAGDKYLTT